MQDFAGSTVVHLIGATGALAALLLLGPRIGKYDGNGKPRVHGHSMPLVGLGVLILWLGWFGFNAGSTWARSAAASPRSWSSPTWRAAAAIAAVSVMYLKTKTIDIGMAGNGAIAGLVAITAPSGYVDFYAAPIIGAVGGVIVVLGVLAIEKVLDDPVRHRHGLAGVWGTLACGLFTTPSWRSSTPSAGPGSSRGGPRQLGDQALGVAVAFAACSRSPTGCSP